MNKREQRKRNLERQQQILSAAKTANRDLTAEEQTELDQLARDAETLRIQIEQEERQAAAQQPGAGQEGTQTRGMEGNPNAAITAERQRAAEIMSLCRDFGIEPKDYIQNGTSVDEVRAAVLETVRGQHAPIQTRGTADISVQAAAEDKYREAASDAILLRSGIDVEKPAEGAKELRAMSLRDLAIESLSQAGETNLNRRSSEDLYQMLMQRAYFNPSASFPAIMDTAINKAYVQGHKSVNVTFDKFTKKGTLSDFKTHDNNYLAGPAGEFLEVPEGGELKHDLPTDEKMPTRKLKTYGRSFTMTRQAFINDDIGFLTRVPAKYAASARKTQNKQVYQILCNNPAIYDGTALFSSGHKNTIASGTGITRDSMQKMIMALQTQVDQFGEAIIINPATLVVPSGYAFDIYTILFSPTINTTGNTQSSNPLYRYREMIEVVEDPTINVLCGGFGNVMPWFLIGSKNDTDFMEIDYLNGQEVPTIRRMEAPGQLGFQWDVYLDWGITVTDFRGAVKNPGTTVANPLA